jgi:hypothetical protein
MTKKKQEKISQLIKVPHVLGPDSKGVWQRRTQNMACRKHPLTLWAGSGLGLGSGSSADGCEVKASPSSLRAPGTCKMGSQSVSLSGLRCVRRILRTVPGTIQLLFNYQSVLFK